MKENYYLILLDITFGILIYLGDKYIFNRRSISQYFNEKIL
tara:strand:+ start:354 stop:476 length:123 start_codon:yes stop_codon:yes gene_type:complete